MHCVLIIHRVKDYRAWKSFFDEAQNIRKKAGELSYQLFRYDDDENNVVHLSCWTSIDDAKLFFESPELIELRLQAGVQAPRFIYLHEIERSVL